MCKLVFADASVRGIRFLAATTKNSCLLHEPVAAWDVTTGHRMSASVSLTFFVLQEINCPCQLLQSGTLFLPPLPLPFPHFPRLSLSLCLLFQCVCLCRLFLCLSFCLSVSCFKKTFFFNCDLMTFDRPDVVLKSVI